MNSPRDQIPLGSPPDNQVPGPVSNDRGHSTNALPDMVHQLQSKGHSTRGHSTRTRLSKGHSTHQLLETGSLDPGSLDQRAARPEARSAEQESIDSGSLNPHESQHGSLHPPVAATRSLDPGSRQDHTTGSLCESSVSILPLAPEAVGTAEYIVLAEAVAQVGIILPDQQTNTSQ
jgi:hypothetical protein